MYGIIIVRKQEGSIIMEEKMNNEIILDNQATPQRSYKSSKVLLIIGAVIIGLTALAYLIFQSIIFIETINVQPDPEATIDPVGISNAAYVIFTLISTIIAVIIHTIGIALSAIGLVLNSRGQRKRALTLWGTLQIIIPFVIYIVGFVSMFVIQYI